MGAVDTFFGTVAGAYRGTVAVPQALRVRQSAVIVMSVVTALLALNLWHFCHSVTQTIGNDAAPSIVAAAKARATLADAHTQIINRFVAREPIDGPSMRAYADSMAAAQDKLLFAGQNITYGDDERKPLLAALIALAHYERDMGQALESSGYSPALAHANVLMQEQILPELDQLGQVNLRYLDLAYASEQRHAYAVIGEFAVASLVLVALLVETQRKLSRTFRRIFNLPMLVATLVFALSGFAILFTATLVVADVRVGKEDAFDSVRALVKAEAESYSANASESLYLLAETPAVKAEQTRFFRDEARLMLAGGLEESGLPQDRSLLKGQGFIADELANITFPGEEQAAQRTLAAWQEYVHIDARIRQLEESGQHDQAVALCLGTAPHQSDWAFEQFTAALDATLKINEDAFTVAMGKSCHRVKWLAFLILPLLLAPILGAWLGLSPRLAEFAQ